MDPELDEVQEYVVESLALGFDGTAIVERVRARFGDAGLEVMLRATEQHAVSLEHAAAFLRRLADEVRPAIRPLPATNGHLH